MQHRLQIDKGMIANIPSGLVLRDLLKLLFQLIETLQVMVFGDLTA